MLRTDVEVKDSWLHIYVDPTVSQDVRFDVALRVWDNRLLHCLARTHGVRGWFTMSQTERIVLTCYLSRFRGASSKWKTKEECINVARSLGASLGITIRLEEKIDSECNSPRFRRSRTRSTESKKKVLPIF